MGDKIGGILEGLGDTGLNVYQTIEDARDKTARREQNKVLLELRKQAADDRVTNKAERQAQQDYNNKLRYWSAKVRQAKLSSAQADALAEALGIDPDTAFFGDGTDAGSLIEPVEDANATKGFEGISFGPGGSRDSSVNALLKSFGSGGGGRKKSGGKAEPFGGKAEPFFDYDPDTGETATYSVPSKFRPAVASQITAKGIKPGAAASQRTLLEKLLSTRTPTQAEPLEPAGPGSAWMKMGGAAAPVMTENLNQYLTNRAPETIIQSILNAGKEQGLVKPPPGVAAPAAPSQDAMALEWATANPNDPRAAAILQRLGR